MNLVRWLFAPPPSRETYWHCGGCGSDLPLGYWHQCPGRAQAERQSA